VAVVPHTYVINQACRIHILYGDAKGGGHKFGFGHPSKSKFPQHWSDQEILNAIIEIANDTNSRATPGWGGRLKITGRWQGLEIVAIVDPSSWSVITGYPA